MNEWQYEANAIEQSNAMQCSVYYHPFMSFALLFTQQFYIHIAFIFQPDWNCWFVGFDRTQWLNVPQSKIENILKLRDCLSLLEREKKKAAAIAPPPPVLTITKNINFSCWRNSIVRAELFALLDKANLLKAHLNTERHFGLFFFSNFFRWNSLHILVKTNFANKQAIINTIFEYIKR